MPAIRRPRRAGRVVPPLGRGLWPLSVPAVIVTTGLIIVPLGYSLVLAFTGAGGGFGLANVQRMLADDMFWGSLRVTLLLFGVCLAVQMVLGVALGYLMSIDVPGRRIVQGAILVPAIIASVAVGLLWLLFYDPSIGTANLVLRGIGLEGLVWLGDPAIAPWALIIADTWQWTPFVALIVSAGIRALPAEVFEAAAMDGASGWRKAVYVGLPLLAPVLTVAILLRTVDLVRFFDLAYIMTQGGPINATNTLNLYGYREAFVNQNAEYAAALQITLFLCVVGIAALFTASRRRFAVEH